MRTLLILAVLIGVLCGVAASWFVEALNLARQGFGWLRRRFALWPPLLPLLGGVVLALLLAVLPREYMGLSLPVMERALLGEAEDRPSIRPADAHLLASL